MGRPLVSLPRFRPSSAGKSRGSRARARSFNSRPCYTCTTPDQIERARGAMTHPTCPCCSWSHRHDEPCVYPGYLGGPESAAPVQAGPRLSNRTARTAREVATPRPNGNGNGAAGGGCGCGKGKCGSQDAVTPRRVMPPAGARAAVPQRTTATMPSHHRAARAPGPAGDVEVAGHAAQPQMVTIRLSGRETTLAVPGPTEHGIRARMVSCRGQPGI